MTRGWFCRLIRRLKRQSNQLVSYEDLIQHNTRIGQRELGTQIVCIDQIIGSLGRCEDFDRAFYPCQTFTRTRWLSIAKAKYQEVTLPLVELYKIGDTYFVKDEHHRISVARCHGQDYIDAQVLMLISNTSLPTYRESMLINSIL